MAKYYGRWMLTVMETGEEKGFTEYVEGTRYYRMMALQRLWMYRGRGFFLYFYRELMNKLKNEKGEGKKEKEKAEVDWKKCSNSKLTISVQLWSRSYDIRIRSMFPSRSKIAHFRRIANFWNSFKKWPIFHISTRIIRLRRRRGRCDDGRGSDRDKLSIFYFLFFVLRCHLPGVFYSLSRRKCSACEFCSNVYRFCDTNYEITRL